MAREYSVRSAAAHKCLRYVYEALDLMPVIVIVFAFALTWLGRIGKEICQISQISQPNFQLCFKIQFGNIPDIVNNQILYFTICPVSALNLDKW